MTPRLPNDALESAHHLASSRMWDAARRIARRLFLVILLGAILNTPSAAEPEKDIDPIAIPAEFISEVRLPGNLDHFIRPGRVFFDPVADELFVADRGNNRLVVMDRHGTYRFEIVMAGRIGYILDFTVSADGTIDVLSTTREGLKLLTFDFDGLFLGERLIAIPGEGEARITTMVMDKEKRVYLLDGSGPRLLRYTPDGQLDLEVPLLRDLDERQRLELVFGSMTMVEDGLLVPVSSLGMVYRLTFDGEHVRTYGRQGSVTGELAFPVSAAVSGEGLVLVLDQRRFNVLCFSPRGQFVGEFGGKGYSLGWFYFPSFIATDEFDQVYVSQVYLNRVQVCRVPQSFVRRWHKKEHPVESIELLGSAAGGGDLVVGDPDPDRAHSVDKQTVSSTNHHFTQGGL